MSKLAAIRQHRYAPAAGGLFGLIPDVLGGIISVFGKKKKTPAQEAAPTKAAAVKAAPSVNQAAAMLRRGGGFGKRSKGISGKELSGYRKVARLLHKEGMVSKRARGRKS